MIIKTRPGFEVTSKRRKGFPSETRVKRGLRFVRGGEKELVEKLGRNDPCPCGSGKRFQTLLHDQRPVSMDVSARIIGGDGGATVVIARSVATRRSSWIASLRSQ